MTTPGAIEVETVPHDDAGLTALLAEAHAEARRRYPELEGVKRGKLTPDIVFVVARRDGMPVGCCAVQPEGPRLHELKRMFVVPAARGSGIADELLAAVERIAADAGSTVLRLETGTRQPEAIRFYERSGFAAIPRYPPYLDDPFARCYAKSLI